MRATGWQLVRSRSHGYAETEAPRCMLTLVDRGADVLLVAGAITENTAAALKQEARERARSGRFFGHIAYGSVLARKGA